MSARIFIRTGRRDFSKTPERVWHGTFAVRRRSHKYFLAALIPPHATADTLRTSGDKVAQLSRFALTLPLPGAGAAGTRSACTSADRVCAPRGLRVGHRAHREHGLVMDATGVARAALVSRADPCGDSHYGIAIISCPRSPSSCSIRQRARRSAACARCRCSSRGQEFRRSTKSEPEKVEQGDHGALQGDKANPLGGCLPMLVQMPFSSRSTGC